MLKPSCDLRKVIYNIYQDDKAGNKGGGTAISVKSIIDFNTVKINASIVLPSELDSLLSEKILTILAGCSNAKPTLGGDYKKGRDLAKYSLSDSIVLVAPD